MKPIHLTNQDLFNAAWEQSKLKTKSTDGAVCLYRGPNGAKCFIGAAIPDERYDPSIERRSMSYALAKTSLTADDWRFARELQVIHDFTDVSKWDQLLRGLAKEYSLTIPGETE